MGIDGGRIQEFAGLIHHRHLDPGTDARVQAHGGPMASRGGQEQILQVAPEDPDGLVFRLVSEHRHEFGFQVQGHFYPPGPAHRVLQPFVPGAALILDAETLGNALFAGVGAAGLIGFVQFAVQHQGEAEEAFVAAPEEGQGPVGGNGQEGFGKVEIVPELGPFRFLAFHHGGFHHPVFVQVIPQLAQQFRIFGKAFHENLPSTVQYRLDVGKAPFPVQVSLCFRLRIQARIGQQGVGQGLEPGFPGDLGLGAALGFVGQIEGFQALLGVRLVDFPGQGRGELALFLNTGQDGLAALFQLPQIGEPLLQGAQLGVIQSPGGFLPVAGDEGHGGAFVQQGDGRHDLLGADAQLFGNAVFDGRQHGNGGRKKEPHYAETGHKRQGAPLEVTWPNVAIILRYAACINGLRPVALFQWGAVMPTGGGRRTPVRPRRGVKAPDCR